MAQAMHRHSLRVTSVKLMSDSSGLSSTPRSQLQKASTMLHRPMLVYQRRLVSRSLSSAPLVRRDSMGAVHVARTVNHALSATRLTHCTHQQQILRCKMKTARHLLKLFQQVPKRATDVITSCQVALRALTNHPALGKSREDCPEHNVKVLLHEQDLYIPKLAKKISAWG